MPLYADFHLGLGRRPNLPLEHAFEPVALDDELLPGGTVVGRLAFARPGKVHWVVRGVVGSPLTCPDLPGFEAHLFVTEMPDRPRGLLKRIYQAAVLGCLADPVHALTNPQTAQAYLAQGPERSDFQAALERAPLFEDHTGRNRYSLEELAGHKIYLLPIYVDRELLSRQRPANTRLLRYSPEVVAVFQAYGLEWTGLDQFEEDVAGNEWIVPLALREQAIEVSFGSPRESKGRLEYPIYNSRPLVVDQRRRVICGPHRGGYAELPFDSLVRADLDEKEVEGDLKVHRYYYLWISDGRTDLVYYQRMKEYYEGGLHELEAEQSRATRNIFALPGLLGAPSRSP